MTTKQTHTPDTLEIYYDSAADIYLVVEKDSYHDWSVERPDERFIFARCATKEQADYIAAVPDLYTWASDLVEYVERYPMITENPDITDSIRMLKKAIAKPTDSGDPAAY